MFNWQKEKENRKHKIQNTLYNCIYIQCEIEVTPKLGLNSRDSFNSGNENIPPSIWISLDVMMINDDNENDDNDYDDDDSDDVDYDIPKNTK